jgi:hypothetical protein
VSGNNWLEIRIVLTGYEFAGFGYRSDTIKAPGKNFLKAKGTKFWADINDRYGLTCPVRLLSVKHSSVAEG